MGLELCVPPVGQGKEREAEGSLSGAPQQAGGCLSCPASLLLLRQVGGWGDPGVEGLPGLGVVAGRGTHGGVPGREAAPCPGSWGHDVPAGSACSSLHACPADSRGSGWCLPSCYLPRLGVVSWALPSCKEGCVHGICLVPCVRLFPSGCYRSCLYPLLLCPPTVDPAWSPSSLCLGLGALSPSASHKPQ